MRKIALLLLCGVWISFFVSVFFTLTPYIDKNPYFVDGIQIIQGALLVAYFFMNFPLGFELENQTKNLLHNTIFSLLALLLVAQEFNSKILLMIEISCLVGCSISLMKILEIEIREYADGKDPEWF